MKHLSYILILSALLLFSCDRFEHDFVAPDTEDIDTTFFEPLELAFGTIIANDMSALDAFYADDYMHNSINKGERLSWIQGFLNQDPSTVFQLSDQEFNQIDNSNAIVNWRLRVIGGDQQILADSLFVGERIIRQAQSWMLYGNQVCVQQIGKQLVIAEYFTFRTCPNCPDAEEKLHQLQAQYPENFIYLEHHISMELAVPGDDTYLYYQAYSPPVSVFQGMEKVLQSNPASLDQYQAIVDNLVLVDEPVVYELSAVNVQSNEVSAVVYMDPLIELELSDLVLNYVIISDDVQYVNYAGDPLHNVVRALGSHSLAEADLAAGIPINLNIPEGLPQSSKLVVFAQHKPANFENNSIIYGGIVQALSLENSME